MGSGVERIVELITEKSKKNPEIMDLEYFLRGVDSYRSKIHINNVNHDLQIIRAHLPAKSKVLDFGCGFGIQSAVLAEKDFQVVGLETVEDKSLDHFFKGDAEKHKSDRDRSLRQIWNWLKEDLDSLEFRYYDGKHIPFPDGYFDAILAYAVLEHIPEDELPGTLGELSRILRAKGLLYIFQFPRAESYSEFIAHRLGLEAHDFLLSEQEIIKLIEDHGFRIKERYLSDL
ncbi:MAG TPA: class I SAM-dependent methyltransferase, partial [bacterium (Candidatus Stahlbacteria)]|nr:class I SAM-dependent methyltransferase [Candidatus Stahlbacteria bacterium]